MIFITLILLVKSCFRIEKDFDNVNLYPTNGEYLEYSMSDIFWGGTFFYHYEPIIPNVKIANGFNEITNIEGNQFVSISSNQTHFATITTKNQVILYEWSNLTIYQYGKILTIEERYQCNNILLFADIDVLLDCYDGKHFYLLKLMNTSFNIVYSIQSNKPISSEIQGIYNESKAFIIYAQYYHNLSILTLFSSQFINLTSYQNQFLQISIPLRANPYIYILSRKSLSQFIINQNLTFEETSKYNASSKITLDYFQVYYDYQTVSECDQLIILEQDSQEGDFSAYYLLGCQNLLIYQTMFSYANDKLSQLIQFFMNNQFVLFQSQDYLTLYQQEYNEFAIGWIEVDKKNSQIYFNPFNNYLFEFGKQIIVYELAIPQLQINLTNQQLQGNKYDIIIYAQFLNLPFNGICRMYISITILDQNDTNIYVIYNQNFPQYEFLTGPKKTEQVFTAYSGKLLSYSLNTNNQQFGQYQNITFQEIFKFTNQSFYLAQLLQAKYPKDDENRHYTYFIGITKKSIQIYIQNSDQNESFQLITSINITIQAQQLQVAYNIYGILIIGLSDKETIYLYQIYPTFSQEYKEQYCKLKFSEFLIAYNFLITLIRNREIQIMTLNFTGLVRINEDLIRKLFNLDNLQFTPIQITVNTESLSSLLFINNINNVIIITIGQNNQPLPISIINLNFNITSINIVNQQLILSYMCNSGFDLCFQVWSIQNCLYPFFVKNMMSVHYDKQIQILSDNLFFYVQFENYTVVVYNPYYPEHMSLYYQKELSSPLICTVQKSKYNEIFALMFYENKLSSLSTKLKFELQLNESLNFERTYPQVIYNYYVTSSLNQTALQYTPNQSLTYFSNFTYFQPKTYKTLNLLKEDLNSNDRTFTIPMNIILDRQVSLCNFNDSSDNSGDQYFSNNVCELANFGYYDIISNNKSYTLVTTINNQFFVLQNNQEIQIINQKNELLNYFNYSNFNFTECLKSTSFNLTLSSLCQNETAQYWLSISFDSLGEVTDKNVYAIPKRFTNISKIINLLTLNFILGSLYQSNYEVYLFNSSSCSLQLLQQNCQDFSVALFNSSLDINQENLGIIAYIINNTYNYPSIYQLFQFEKNSIEMMHTQRLQWKQNDQIRGAQISILHIIYNEIFMIITNNEGIGQLIVFNLIFRNNFLSVKFGQIITTIPAYGNLQQIPNSVYSNGFLIQQFQQENTYIIGVYQINQFFKNILEEPILMLGSFNSTSPEYALITNKENQNATCLGFQNGSIISYPINTKTLKCRSKKHKNTVQVNLSCSNEFSSGFYELTFNLDLTISKRGWIYSLIIIIIIQLIGFYILIKYRMKNIGYINTQIEI